MDWMDARKEMRVETHKDSPYDDSIAQRHSVQGALKLQIWRDKISTRASILHNTNQIVSLDNQKPR